MKTRASARSRQALGTPAAPAAFPAECSIVQAPEVKALLAPLLHATEGVTLDLSPIRRIDTAALQVLTAFIRERRAAGRSIDCKGAGETFLHTAKVLGLSALFEPAVGA